MKPKAITIVIFVLVLFTGLFENFSTVTAMDLVLATEVIYPSDDSYVNKRAIVGSVWTNTSDWNYGNETALQVTTTVPDDRERRTFLKFSLSSISSPEDIVSVKLFLFENGHESELPGPGLSAVGNVEARTVDNDSWTEEGITWNNQPAYGTLLDTTYVEFNANQWYSWEVTSFILGELSADMVASLCLKAENESQGDTYRYSFYWSKEHEDLHPHLLISYESEPSDVTAPIDVHPSTLNLKSRGRWITCCIELSEGYIVNNIDRATILLNSTVPVDQFWINKPLESVVGDYDNDKIPDLMVKFSRAAVIEQLFDQNTTHGNVALTVTGELYDGTIFEGSDIIRVKMPSNAMAKTSSKVNSDNERIFIMPEFSAFFILPLFMITTLLAVIVHRRKHAM